ncbi:MAG: HAMP domain-containing histidine kinase [Spirulinaceae cyanobacterium RM2_2_10]|nr:HAMP domain-containing histidine kinase [Spirulinaceae cyanobacterium RM2_2_10]
MATSVEQVFYIGSADLRLLLYISLGYEKIWQRRCQDLYAYPESWLESIVPADRPQALRMLVRMRAGRAVQMRYRIQRPDGSQRWIFARSFPVQDEAGRVLRHVGIAEDITERQAIEQMKDEFISIVSHELRTPMTAIYGALQLLNSGRVDLLSPQGNNMLAIALRNSDRLRKLIDNILSLERLQSGKLTVKPRICSTQQLLTSALETIQPLANLAQVAVDTRQVTDISVWADAELIVQVLVNLLNNAISFSPLGETIAIAVTKGSESNVIFAVSDRGTGIPDDKLAVIFERFQQVDPSDSRQRGGSGLGLTICQQIIDRHNGRIWAESQLGVGSTFYFTLPQAGV